MPPTTSCCGAATGAGVPIPSTTKRANACSTTAAPAATSSAPSARQRQPGVLGLPAGQEPRHQAGHRTRREHEEQRAAGRRHPPRHARTLTLAAWRARADAATAVRRLQRARRRCGAQRRCIRTWTGRTRSRVGACTAGRGACLLDAPVRADRSARGTRALRGGRAGPDCRGRAPGRARPGRRRCWPTAVCSTFTHCATASSCAWTSATLSQRNLSTRCGLLHA